MKPKINRKQGGKYDDCQTPAYAVEALWHETGISQDTTLVWEPAAGQGYLAKWIHSLVCEVYASTIEDTTSVTTLSVVLNRDFLNPEDVAACIRDINHRRDSLKEVSIITNPPYSGKLKQQFLNMCLNLWTRLGFGFALLMPHEFGSTKGYYDLTRKYRAIPNELRFSRRVNFKMPEFGWTGPENRENWLDHWVAVRRRKAESDPKLAELYRKNPKKLYETPTAQFPVTWFWIGFDGKQGQIQYVDIEPRAASEMPTYDCI